MSISILTPGGQAIPACCRFEFKGFTISVSTVFPRSGERIAVLDGAGRGLFYCFTVEEAVVWVDGRIESQAPERKLRTTWPTPNFAALDMASVEAVTLARFATMTEEEAWQEAIHMSQTPIKGKRYLPSHFMKQWGWQRSGKHWVRQS